MRRLLLAAATAAALIPTVPAHAARTDDAKKPVLLLLSKDMGDNCNTALDRYVKRLPTTTITTSNGKEKFTGDIKTLGMRGVSGCDDVLTTQNNPNATLWNEAYTFARWIDTNYPNKPVDVIASGVSGLVVRFALTQSQRHRDGVGGDATVFPDDLQIEDVVTLGTPHQPTATMDSACPECDDLHSTDHELWDVLNTAQGQDPNGVGGTDWSAIASNGDTTVPVSSALGMSAEHKTTYLKPAFDHKGYLTDIDTSSDASIQYSHTSSNSDAMVQWNRAPHTYWRVVKELVFGDTTPEAQLPGGPDCTGYNEAKGGATVIADPRLAGWDGPPGALRIVRAGTIEAISQCFKKITGGAYEATGLVRIDGLDLKPSPGKSVIIDPDTRHVTSGGASISLPLEQAPIPLLDDHALSWTYPRTNGSVSPTDGELIKPSGGVKIGGFAISGSLGVTVGLGSGITGGYTQVDLTVSLPMYNGQLGNSQTPDVSAECSDGLDNDVDKLIDANDPDCKNSKFEAGVPAGPGLSGTVKTTNAAGATLDKLGGKFEGAFAIDTVKLKGSFSFLYTLADNSWKASGTATFPLGTPLTVSASMGYRDGEMTDFSVELKGLRIPVAPVPGLFVSRLKGGAVFDPFQLTLGSGVVYGPIPNVGPGAPPYLADVNGDLTFGQTASGASMFKLSGDGSFLGNQVASGSLQWTDGQGWKLETNVGKSFTLGDPSKKDEPYLTTTINAGVSGTLNDQGLDVTGSAQLCIKGSIVIVTLDTTCAVNARVRASKHGDQIALSACGGITVLAHSIEIGSAIVWPNGLGGNSISTAMVDTCDVDKWHTPAATTRAARGSPTTFTLPKGKPAELVGVEGDGGAPDVVLTGPDGRRIESARSDDLTQTPDHASWRVPTQHMTYVLIGDPAAGAWSVAAQDGSVPITAVRVADTRPEPKVHVRVRRGHGRTRVVHYTVTPLDGQRVFLHEHTDAGLDKLIGEARGSHGSLRFRPVFGAAGRRQIVAQVVQNGAPRTELVAGSYVAPAPPRAGRVRAVALTRRGSRVTMTWRPAVRAVGYDVELKLPDGRVETHELGASARRIVIGHVRGRHATTVSLTALRAHDHRPGPAVFVRGGALKKKAARKRGRG